jgi:hypothetical protein
MTEDSSNRDFAQTALDRLPASGPSRGLERTLIAAYDAWNATRPEGRWPALQASLRHFLDSIWPGAPLWAPLSAFAFALLVGAGLGAALPSIVNDEQPGFSLEQPASFSLSAIDVTQEDM